MAVKTIILAAGKGSRMCSDHPKVLHKLAGKPLLSHILTTLESLNVDELIVVQGYQAQALQAAIDPEHTVTWVHQAEQLGTAHAVGQTLGNIKAEDHILILTGDVPLISTKAIAALTEVALQNKFGIVTVELEDATGYGRIQRDLDGRIVNIVEHNDATDEEKAITEINTGIMAMPAKFLLEALPKIGDNNAQNEYYLTDIVALAAKSGLAIEAIQPEHNFEVEGVNTKNQLANLERKYQAHLAKQYMSKGLMLIDPNRVDFRGELQFGRDVSIDINVIFEGKNVLADGCIIGANCILKDVVLAEGVEIKPMSVLEGVVIGKGAQIGPFARLRPGTELGDNTKVGNFVEVKKSKIANGSKVSHLSYIGDAQLGQDVNIGAGTITCNYDGVNKHLTTIEDDVFVGSNTSLVAPVTIGQGANIGAGSTISRNVPAYKLALTRAKQIVIESWKRPSK